MLIGDVIVLVAYGQKPYLRELSPKDVNLKHQTQTRSDPGLTFWLWLGSH